VDIQHFWKCSNLCICTIMCFHIRVIMHSLYITFVHCRCMHAYTRRNNTTPLIRNIISVEHKTWIHFYFINTDWQTMRQKKGVADISKMPILFNIKRIHGWNNCIALMVVISHFIFYVYAMRFSEAWSILFL